VFSPFELDQEEKAGIDAVRIIIPVGDLSELDLIVADKGSVDDLSGGFHLSLNLDDIDLLYVVNIYRPETDGTEKIIQAIHRLESEAQLKVTGLINNTNLMQHTTVDDILQGEHILQEVGAELQLPIVYTVIEEQHDFDHPFAGEIIRLQRLVAKKWL